jgi:hypothetical protein
MLILVPVEIIIIIEAKILADRDVNIKETTALGGVIRIYLQVLLAEPLNLVGMDTPPPLLIQTVLSASVEEPYTEGNIFSLLIIDWQPVIEGMRYIC